MLTAWNDGMDKAKVEIESSDSVIWNIELLSYTQAV